MKRTKLMIPILIIVVVIIGTLGVNYFYYGDIFYFIKPELNITINAIIYKSDLDNDGLNDLEDIIQGAREEVKNKTKYKSAYYDGGYPPDDEGVCTDVIWRALQNSGYNLKDLIDKDIKENIDDYPNIDIRDPNIDFRRVGNLYVFFEKYMENLTLDVIPYDVKNLEEWQGGDIVIIKDSSHIAIISEYRRKDGVPYVIHNNGPYPKEEDKLLYWYKRDRIIGHFRIVDSE